MNLRTGAALALSTLAGIQGCASTCLDDGLRQDSPSDCVVAIGISTGSDTGRTSESSETSDGTSTSGDSAEASTSNSTSTSGSATSESTGTGTSDSGSTEGALESSTGSTGTETCDRVEMDHLIPRIGVSSQSAPGSDPFSIEFEDLSTSSGTIVARTWSIEDAIDHLGVPDAIGCSEGSTCTYSGTEPAAFDQPTLLLPNVATATVSNGSFDHDDFVVTLEVTDSNGLTAMTRFNYSDVSGMRLLSTLAVTATLNGDTLTTEIEDAPVVNDLGAFADIVRFDVDADQVYEDTRENTMSSVFPQTFEYPWAELGTYTFGFVTESPGFRPAEPEWEQFLYTELSVALTCP